MEVQTILKHEKMNKLFQSKRNAVKFMIKHHFSLIRLEIRMMRV